MLASDSIKREIEAMPIRLRSLIEAELAAGNGVVEIGHSFPAPPIGAFFKLARPLLTRERRSGDGIDYRARNSSLCSGEMTDVTRRYFLIEPPVDDGTPRLDAVGGRASVETTLTDSVSLVPDAWIRFQASTVVDYEKWHDGVGYDLDALREMFAIDKTATEALLLARGVSGWRDIEALASLGTPAAIAAIKSALSHGNPEVRIAIARYVPELISESDRVGVLIKQLETATFFAGLSQTLDEVAEFHPIPVIEVLLRGVLCRPGDIAVHFAAMLCYIHGRAPEPFDLNQRGFFLRFNTEVGPARECAFRELCEKIGADGLLYLKNGKTAPANVSAVDNADYAVEVDVRGEMLTYCEPKRSAHVICTFHPVPCIVIRTLSNWYYPLGRRTEKMSPEEKKVILNRLADYCRNHHGMTKQVFG